MLGRRAVADTSLARDAIGLREVIFQSVAFMGLGATIVSSLPLTMAYAGGSAIISALLCLLALLTVALCVAALAKHLPTAGSFYTYASQGIHPSVGFLVGWAYTLLTILVEPLLVLILAVTLAGIQPFNQVPGLWWLWAVIAIAFVYGLGYFGIRTSSVANVVLGIFELAVFGVLSVWLIGAAGSNNTLAVFSTQYANVPNYTGFGGIIVGMLFTVLAFSGFEAAAPLAEEARAPKKTIGQAVIVALLVVAAIELVSIYAATVFYGPTKMLEFSQIGGGIGANWIQLAQKVWGIGWVLVLLAIVNSCLANANAGANTSTRTIYALGRIRLLPRWLASIHPRWKSPHIAVTAQLVVGLAITLALGFKYGPAVAFGIIGTVIGILFAALYIVINLSCILYYWRQQHAEFNWIRHGVIPVVGIVVLIPVFIAGNGIPVFSFISPLTAPFSYAGPAILIWMLIGAAFLVYLLLRDQPRLRDTARVFLAEESETGAAQAQVLPTLSGSN